MSETKNTSNLLRESGEEKNVSIKYNEDIMLDSDLESNNSDTESEEYVLKPKNKQNTKIQIMSRTDNSDNSKQELPSVNDVINEYYKLKEKFESEINKNKKKIINNSTLSNREKRSEYLKLMPKCVNCKRPSKKGTIFSITYHPADDNISEHKVFKAICGNLADPCNLHIELNIGTKTQLDEELNNIRNEITEAKNNIINDKNKLLFGLITTETAIENFDYNKTYISELTNIYEKWLDIWNKEVDNPEKKLELDEMLVQSYETINIIKDCINKMNETNDTHFATDAATIYHTTLQPLLNKIRQLKYRENMVFNDDNYCKLIQHKYLTDDILISSYDNKIVAYDVGLKATGFKKKSGLIIDSEESENGLSIKITKPDESKLTGEIVKSNEPLEDEPIIGQGLDGIEWHTQEYKKLWSGLPQALKTEFKSNIDWMKEFMYKCVNERENHGPEWNGCRLTTPPNLIIPPREMENGQYDFGVSIYNKIFSKLPKSVKSTYLTLYKEDPTSKIKNYSMLEDTMNRQVENELDFGRGFF